VARSPTQNEDDGGNLMPLSEAGRQILSDVLLPSPTAEPSIMGMPSAAHRWTAEEVRALPDDGNRYELVSGELLVTPSPRGVHQVMLLQLIRHLDPWLERHAVGHLMVPPADLSLGEDEVLQPDLFVYQTASGRQLRDWADITAVLLAVEILSPSTAHWDRTIKRHRYQRADVPEYWIVDLDARLIERWRPDDSRPEILAEQITWQPNPAADPLEIDLAGLFSES
jgi:Uma2 family endonuclease